MTQEKAIAIAGACLQYERCEDCPLCRQNKQRGESIPETCFGDYEKCASQIEQNFVDMFPESEVTGFPVFEKEAETAQRPSVPNAVLHPTHYTNGGIECIEAIKASMAADGFADYCKGNVLKYIWRWREKGGVEDLKKAQVYLGWLIEAVGDDG